MSDFITFAKRLDAAFRAARDDCNAALDVLNTTREAVENFDKFQPQRYAGENDAKLRALQQDRTDAERNYERTIADVWAKFERKRDTIRAELETAINKASMATPEQVNSGALELIKSDILSVDEIESLFQRFSNEGNNAMQRIIGRYAIERADRETDARNRERLTVIYATVNHGKGDVLEKWRVLEDTSTRFLGHNRLDGRTNFYGKLAAKWEEATGELVESF